MPFVDTGRLKVTERLPGWNGRYFHTANMTFAHYDFKRGASIHEHFHPQEEVYEVIEGELEMTIGGATEVAHAGLVAIVPSNAPHSVKALTDGPQRLALDLGNLRSLRRRWLFHHGRDPSSFRRQPHRLALRSPLDSLGAFFAFAALYFWFRLRRTAEDTIDSSA